MRKYSQGSGVVIRFIGLGVLALVVSFLGTSNVYAEPMADDSICREADPDGKGSIDWTNGMIQATGMGFPNPKDANARQAEENAKRAATVVARRNLLEMIQGIVVDSTTVVENLMVKSDKITNKVQGIIKHSRVIKEQRFPDGGYQVTVEMPVSGEFSNLIVPSRTAKPNSLKFPTTARKKDGPFTGLIINAQGLSVQRALSPRILMEDGQVVYSSEWVDPSVKQGETLVGYVCGMEAAKTNERVTADPMEVKALRVTGDKQTDIVISNTDAQMLHMVPAHQEFLEKAKVLFVLDR